MYFPLFHGLGLGPMAFKRDLPIQNIQQPHLGLGPLSHLPKYPLHLFFPQGTNWTTQSTNYHYIYFNSITLYQLHSSCFTYLLILFKIQILLYIFNDWDEKFYKYLLYLRSFPFLISLVLWIFFFHFRYYFMYSKFTFLIRFI